MNSIAKQHGFSMLEVLIAILVTAFGLLGLAGMQLNGLKQASNSSARSIATILAYDIADRMRANPDPASGGAYSTYNGQQGTYRSACFATTGCNRDQMAQTDVAAWAEQLASLLPSGRGAICVDSTPNDGTPAAPACDNAPNAPYAIKIWWDERDPSGQPARFVTVFRM